MSGRKVQRKRHPCQTTPYGPTGHPDVARLVIASTLVAASLSPTVHETVPVTPTGSYGVSESWDGLSYAVGVRGAQDSARWFSEAASAPVVVTLKTRRTPRSGGDVAECIRQRENGGSYDRGTNPTHFGAYQFSRSTWAANGGDPDDWGSASPEEQDRVFANTVARNGYRDWTPYDGCG